MKKTILKGPTPEQQAKSEELLLAGYEWDKILSTKYAAVVLTLEVANKTIGNKDIWVFGLDGTMDHNPPAISIKV